jgi:hypothetical protein
VENKHHVPVFDRELARKTNLVDLQALFSKNKTIILANFQKNKKIYHDTPISQIRSITGKVMFFFPQI